MIMLYITYDMFPINEYHFLMKHLSICIHRMCRHEGTEQATERRWRSDHMWRWNSIRVMIYLCHEEPFLSPHGRLLFFHQAFAHSCHSFFSVSCVALASWVLSSRYVLPTLVLPSSFEWNSVFFWLFWNNLRWSGPWIRNELTPKIQRPKPTTQNDHS